MEMANILEEYLPVDNETGRYHYEWESPPNALLRVSRYYGSPENFPWPLEKVDFRTHSDWGNHYDFYRRLDLPFYWQIYQKIQLFWLDVFYVVRWIEIKIILTGVLWGLIKYVQGEQPNWGWVSHGEDPGRLGVYKF